MAVDSKPVPRSTPRRPEIQALRALAVLAVVLFHFWPEDLHGGYVGVDVFFVISGFLITAHLLREVERTGTIALSQFWSRRARRLLPAALLVLAVSAIIVFAFVPIAHWRDFFFEIISSAFYFENWTLAANSVNYLAANNVATLSQHYWSLSVEEQFYVVWPLLIIGGVLLSRRAGFSSAKATLFVMLAVITVASFAYSIYLTATVPSAAYFVTPTRAWEFGVGGLLALAASRQGDTGKQSAAIRSVVSWIGLAMLAFTVVKFTSLTPFPSYTAALPVLGTALVLWAGSPVALMAPSRLFALRPVQFVGDISYSLYLWHWPIVTGAIYALGGPTNKYEKAVMLVGCFVLAWLTKRFVEDPVRRSGGFLARRRARSTLVASLAGMCVVLLLAASGIVIIQQRADAALATASAARTSPDVCFGAPAMVASRTCNNSSLHGTIVPDPGELTADTGPGFVCAPGTGQPFEVCHYGSSSPGAYKVALVGDSHSSMMMPALLSQLPALGWSLDTYIAKACVWGNMGADPRCDPRRSIQKTLESGKYDMVITASTRLAHESSYATYPADKPDPRVAGFSAAWEPVVKTGTKVVVIADNPALPQSAVDCLGSLTNSSQAARCAVPVSVGHADSDGAAIAARETPGVNLINLDRFYCTATTCPMVIGNVAVYYDPTHITATYSRSLGPYIGADLRRIAGTAKN
jgi:peptidoglycan/LPS O-acetylase OafA/YrhL